MDNYGGKTLEELELIDAGRKGVLSDLATLVPGIDAAIDKQSMLTCLSEWLEQSARADSEAIRADFAEARRDTARLDWLEALSANSRGNDDIVSSWEIINNGHRFPGVFIRAAIDAAMEGK